jgi:ANTAR domain
MPDEAAVPAGTIAPVTGKTITTSFQAGSGHGYPAFAGVLVHSWAERDPTEDDAIIARLLVDLALAIVQQERLAQAASCAENRAAELAIDLTTSRIEGEAIGILMVTHQAPRQEAVRLLRRMSQDSHRELREVAADVAHTGDLQRLVPTAGRPARANACASPHRRVRRPPGAVRRRDKPDRPPDPSSSDASVSGARIRHASVTSSARRLTSTSASRSITSGQPSYPGVVKKTSGSPRSKACFSAEMRRIMTDRHLENSPVTTSDGQLVGLVRKQDFGAG